MKRAFGNMPRTAASLRVECAAALHAGSPDMALSLIEMALAGGAVDPLYRCYHASCLKTLSRFAEAENAYWNILREHPDTVEATQGLRGLYRAVGQCGAIQAPAKRERSPRHQSAHHRYRATAHLQQGRN